VNLVSRLDADMYRTLDAMIQNERIEERDLVPMGIFRSIGIEKGKPFAPSDKMVAMFNAATKETQDYLRQGYLVDTPIYYPGTQWRVAFTPGVFETRFTWIYPGFVDLDHRGAFYNYAWGSGERVGKATYYINLAADAKGQPLDGSRNYRLKVPANAPVTQFWSATTQVRRERRVHGRTGAHSPCIDRSGRREEPRWVGRRVLRPRNTQGPRVELGAERARKAMVHHVPLLQHEARCFRQVVEHGRHRNTELRGTWFALENQS
jgi:hypothetical protein